MENGFDDFDAIRSVRVMLLLVCGIFFMSDSSAVSAGLVRSLPLSTERVGTEPMIERCLTQVLGVAKPTLFLAHANE